VDVNDPNLALQLTALRHRQVSLERDMRCAELADALEAGGALSLKSKHVRAKDPEPERAIVFPRGAVIL
jgi:hypothetical protein